MELLGGFEPPTSSLPNNDRLLFPVVACRILLFEVIAPQYIHGFTCRYLLSLDVLYPLRFSGCGFGFCCGF